MAASVKCAPVPSAGATPVPFSEATPVKRQQQRFHRAGGAGGVNRGAEAQRTDEKTLGFILTAKTTSCGRGQR